MTFLRGSVHIGERVTSSAVAHSLNERNRRGVRLWGIGIGWVFFGLITFPTDDSIRASREFIDHGRGAADGTD